MKSWIEILIIYLPCVLGLSAGILFLIDHSFAFISLILALSAFCIIPFSYVVGIKRIYNNERIG